VAAHPRPSGSRKCDLPFADSSAALAAVGGSNASTTCSAGEIWRGWRGVLNSQDDTGAAAVSRNGRVLWVRITENPTCARQQPRQGAFQGQGRVRSGSRIRQPSVIEVGDRSLRRLRVSRCAVGLHAVSVGSLRTGRTPKDRVETF